MKRKSFFLGKCQARFAAAAIAGTGDDSLETYVISLRFPFNPLFEGRVSVYIGRDDILLRTEKSPDTCYIGFVQEEILQKASKSSPKLGELLDKFVFFPYAYFSFIYQENPNEVNEKKTKRCWYIEHLCLSPNHEHSDCRLDTFQKSLILNVKTIIYRISPHPTGQALAFAWQHSAQLAPEPLRLEIDAAAVVIGESPGLGGSTGHPVSEALGDALGLEWRRSPSYEALMVFDRYLSHAMDHLDVDVNMAEEFVGDPYSRVYRFIVAYRAFRRVRRKDDASKVLNLGHRRFPASGFLKVILFREHCARGMEAEAVHMFHASARRLHMSLREERHLLRTIDTNSHKSFVREPVRGSIQMATLNSVLGKVSSSRLP